MRAVVKVGLFIWRAEQCAFDLQGRESHAGFDISACESKMATAGHFKFKLKETSTKTSVLSALQFSECRRAGRAV